MTSETHLIKRYDAHMHAIFKEAMNMWNNYTSCMVYFTTNPNHERIIGGLNIDNNYLWEKINRESPFENARKQLETKHGIHIKCKKYSFPTHDEYHFTTEQYDPSKIVPEQHQETTDNKYAKYVREHDTMKHELYNFVKYLIDLANTYQDKSVEYVVNGEYEKTIRITGALDTINNMKWKYIQRKSPFIIVRDKIAKEFGFFISSKYISKIKVGDKMITSFKVRVSPLKNQTQNSQLIQETNVEITK